MSIFPIEKNARVHAHMIGVKHRWWKPFIKQTQNPQAVQQALLERILAYQAETTFGQKHRLSRLRGYHEFRLGVPIHTYEDLRPYLQAQEDLKGLELNHDQPESYALTSGTTGKPKIIPLLPRTKQMLRQLM